MKTEKNILPINKWFPKFSNHPVVIAGPCSAESESQLLNTAIQINEIPQVSVLRAGLWKPRTRPNSFEGVGNVGLEWLKKVKQKTNLLVAVEVATAAHVKECLKSGVVDILWIGARTTTNPFSMIEISESLKDADIAVLVKNPLNPDISLWIGAIERLIKSGIKKVGAIHRGFYPFEKTNLRNIPKWEIPIELKSMMPNLPIINDPSHISGKREYIYEICQKAIDLNFDGLMIETHENPDNALSDAQQQLTPCQLHLLLHQLILKEATSNNADFVDKLENYRNQIDSIDFQILELLSKRMKIVENIGLYKQQNKITIFQIKRWKNIIESRCEFGQKLGLTEGFVKELLKLVHQESISTQSKINKIQL